MLEECRDRRRRHDADAVAVVLLEPAVAADRDLRADAAALALEELQDLAGHGRVLCREIEAKGMVHAERDGRPHAQERCELCRSAARILRRQPGQLILDLR